jgi:hypothetical protein
LGPLGDTWIWASMRPGRKSAIQICPSASGPVPFLRLTAAFRPGKVVSSASANGRSVLAGSPVVPAASGLIRVVALATEGTSAKSESMRAGSRASWPAALTTYLGSRSA